MRFRFFSILLILSFTYTTLSAEDKDSLRSSGGKDFYFLYTQYNNAFSEMPSALTEWRFQDWSYLGAGYEYTKGQFRSLQEHDRLSRLNIKTESVYKLPNTNWVFHGMFAYTNGRADSVSHNLSYTIGRNGSPYYLFQRKAGVWTLQGYEFAATAANRISNKISVGLTIDYVGELSFRTIDSRVNQTALIINLLGSINYHLSNNHTFGIGVGTNRVKTEPSISNKFQQTGEEYNRYLNAGLGSNIKNVNFRFTVINNSNMVSAQWLNQNDHNSYSALYTFNFGQELVDNKNITNLAEQNKILFYDYTQHQVRVTSLNSIWNCFVSNSLEFEMTNGTGNAWEEIGKYYLENYKGEIIKANLNSTLYNPFSFLRRVNLHLGYNTENRMDQKYGYRFEYSNLYMGATAEVLFKLGRVRTGFMLGGGFNKNLDYLHFPNAASSNLYTLWIGDPLMAYLSADYLEIPSYIRLDLPAGNNTVELLLSIKHQYPVNLNYDKGSLFTTNDNFQFYNISLRYFF